MELLKERQREELLKLISQHRELASGFCHPYDRGQVWDLWKKVAKKLNSLGTCKKTPQKWRHYWSHVKSKTRRRQVDNKPLNEFELRVLELAGGSKKMPLNKDSIPKVSKPVLKPPCLDDFNVSDEEDKMSISGDSCMESSAQQEVTSSCQAIGDSNNTSLLELMLQLEKELESSRQRGAEYGARLLAVLRRQLAVQRQQLVCLQQIDTLLHLDHS